MKSKSPNHELINKFLDLNASKSDKYFWPREVKMAKDLLALYSLEFFIYLNPPFPKKLASLAWFKTVDGKSYLNNHSFYFKNKDVEIIPKKEEIVLSATKIDEDIQIIKKPKTLKDFLNLK